MPQIYETNRKFVDVPTRQIKIQLFTPRVMAKRFEIEGRVVFDRFRRLRRVLTEKVVVNKNNVSPNLLHTDQRPLNLSVNL